MGSLVDGEEVGRDEGVLISTRWVGGSCRRGWRAYQPDNGGSRVVLAGRN